MREGAAPTLHVLWTFMLAKWGSVVAGPSDGLAWVGVDRDPLL